MLMHNTIFISNFGTPKRICDLNKFKEIKMFNPKKIYSLFPYNFKMYAHNKNAINRFFKQD